MTQSCDVDERSRAHDSIQIAQRHDTVSSYKTSSADWFSSPSLTARGGIRKANHNFAYIRLPSPLFQPIQSFLFGARLACSCTMIDV